MGRVFSDHLADPSFLAGNFILEVFQLLDENIVSGNGQDEISP